MFLADHCVTYLWRHKPSKAVRKFDLLHQLNGEIHIVPGVWDELNGKGTQCPGRDESASASWVIQHQVENKDLVTALQCNLDNGDQKALPWLSKSNHFPPLTNSNTAL
jgi:predicted nucleic acid-binding protein